MIKMFATVGLFAAVAVAAPAAGHSWQVGNDSFRIYYTDLDMRTGVGRATLLARVERAAKRLCRDFTDPAKCSAEVVRKASQDGRSGRFVQLAMAERDNVALAMR